MGKRLLLIFLVLFGVQQIQAQPEVQLSGEEKAYLYHVVMKSPTLEKNISKYFQYSGEMIWLNDTLPNYDSLELMIIEKPEMLVVYTHDLARVSPGVLSEAANKMAIYKLNKALYNRKSKETENLVYTRVLSSFYDTLRRILPTKALKDKNGDRIIHQRVQNILTPTLSLKAKFSSLSSFHLFTDSEKKQILEAINDAVNKWVEAESFNLFQLLGGHADMYSNTLIAAGDGSITSGLLSEQEKDKKGRWNKGMPKAIGLFPYQIQLVEDKGKTRLEPSRIAFHKSKTVGNDKATLIHLDVWGYNDKKQTTVIIERNNKQYALFGSRDSKLLSPDSSFAGGKTYYYFMHRLEHHYIKHLHEKMYGKKGFKYQLKVLEEKEAKLLMGIKTTEYDLSELRNSGITTTPAGKKKRKIKQQELMSLYTELSKTKAEIKDLKAEMEEAHLKMGKMQEQLANMWEYYGNDHVPFKLQKDGETYLFEDSSTFNIRTQDLVLPATVNSDDYEVRLIGIPGNVFSKSADEVMLQINQTETDENRYLSINLRLNDVFDSDQFILKNELLHKEDSIACYEFMTEILKKKKIQFDLSGKGVGKFEPNKPIIKHPNPAELAAYPSIEHKEFREFKSLRTSFLRISSHNGLTINVSSFTDPVRSNISISNKKVLKLMSMYPDITKNDVLSALRTKAILDKFNQEFGVLAGQYLDRKEASKVVDGLNAAVKKSKISIGKTSIKYTDLSL